MLTLLSCLSINYLIKSRHHGNVGEFKKRKGFFVFFMDDMVFLVCKQRFLLVNSIAFLKLG